MKIRDLKGPTKGNLDILFLITPEEVLRFWVGFSVLLDEAGDRTFTLPSKSEMTKILVHKDMQKVKDRIMTLEDVKTKYGLNAWDINRMYVQREKEIHAELKDIKHWARKRRITLAVDKAKKFRSKNGPEFR